MSTETHKDIKTLDREALDRLAAKREELQRPDRLMKCGVSVTLGAA